MRNAAILSAALVIGMLLSGCNAQGQKARAVDSTLELRLIIVQGAMDLERQRGHQTKGRRRSYARNGDPEPAGRLKAKHD